MDRGHPGRGDPRARASAECSVSPNPLKHTAASWSLSHGASVLPDGSVRFSVWCPKARQVRVSIGAGDGARTLVLTPSGGGLFSGAAAGIGSGADYWYALDDGPLRPDPVSRYRPAGVHGPSRIVDPSSFEWTDQGWHGCSTAELMIYELHVGTFSPEGTFDGVIHRLPLLRDLGVTAVEIMPIAEFPGGRNWGYDGVSLYAPQSTYGGPGGFRRLVDACHAQGLAVILDVVYNHLGPEGNYLPEFGPYSSDRHHTLWGQGWNLDGPHSDEVRRYLLDNALYWLTEFHVDGLRLDAADQMVDLSAVHILEELASAVRLQADALGRRVVLIAESDANDPRFIRSQQLGGFGLDAQWTDDFHHAVHVALTGESQGYFADFGGVRPVAKALADRFVNDGRYSPYRLRRYGHPAGDVPADRFVVCIQNHDQVGNRARGERLSVLVEPAALRLGAALLLLSPYVPLLFMGEEYGETNPFLYFVSHGDADLIQAVREGRRREFAAFGWAGDIPDPQSESTFAGSSLDWRRSEEGNHARLRALYTDLLRMRHQEPALRPGSASISVKHSESDQWVSLSLQAMGSALIAGFNFGLVERTLALESPG
ncbi:MAG TPA: malto-oligosyltrehalose trehalohydrolase, partial [Gemmatimonadales bacterium]|nr:malto-oligosyltrehalose trehalohydrolase [Gemmatimonadales bacterium]